MIFKLLTQTECFQPFIEKLPRTQHLFFSPNLSEALGEKLTFFHTLFKHNIMCSMWTFMHALNIHTCGRNSEPQRRSSRRTPGCQHRSPTVRCKWPPSRGEYLAELSSRPLSALWLSITSSCAFSHTHAFCRAWRAEVF